MNRRNSQRYMHRASVLAAAYGFEVVNRFPGPDPRQYRFFLMEPIGGDDDGDRFADGLVGGKSENALGTPIPGLDHPIKIFADDRVV